MAGNEETPPPSSPKGDADPLARMAQEHLKALSGAAAMPANVMDALRIQRDYEKLFPGGVAKTFESAATLAKQFEASPLKKALDDHKRQSAALGQIFRASELHRDMRKLFGPKFPVAFQEAIRAQNELTRISDLVMPNRSAGELVRLSEALAKAVGAITIRGASPIALKLDAAIAPAVASWRTLAASLPARPSQSQLKELEPVGRATFGLAASSAILVGEEAIVTGLGDWEISPSAMRDRMVARLEQISPRLVQRLEGAWETLRRGGPDAPSQGAHSVVELVDWLLRKTCDSKDVLAWLASEGARKDELDGQGRPTRTAKIRYLMRNRPLEAEVAVTHARSLRDIHGQLQKVKHVDEAQESAAVAKLIYAAESLLIFIVE